MISLIVFGSLVTSLAIISVLAKASPRLLKIVLGYEVFVDLAFSLLIGVACGVSGTMSGFVIGAATGLIFGVSLFILARVYGYTRYENGKWVDYPAKWNVGTAKGLANTVGNKIGGAFKSTTADYANPAMGALVK